MLTVHCATKLAGAIHTTSPVDSTFTGELAKSELSPSIFSSSALKFVYFMKKIYTHVYSGKCFKNDIISKWYTHTIQTVYDEQTRIETVKKEKQKYS
jgi:hypothetical protein